MSWVTPAEHFEQIIAEALEVGVPDHIRAEHQPDPERLEAGIQCVCTCGARCYTYAGHLLEVAEHRALWDQLGEPTIPPGPLGAQRGA